MPVNDTSLKGKIGAKESLTENDKVILNWPGKNSSPADSYAKNTSPQDDTQQSFAKKTFTNFKTCTTEGVEKTVDFNPRDNFIIKGDNLIILYSLRDMLADKIKLIYIDPPYNTGKSGFKYKDNFDHAAWLTFMRQRLMIAKELLTEDGSLWINIDDRESHYLKVIGDEIFGRENFVINFIWQKKYSPANDAKWFSDTHDHILVFAKDKQLFKPNLLARSEAMNQRYANPDNDPRGAWKAGGFSVKTYSKDYDYPVKTPSGKIVYPPKGSCWQTSKENFEKRLAENKIWFGKKGSSKPQIKQFLGEVQQGAVAKSIWTYDEVGHNQVSRREILKLFGEFVFATPKPEKLLKRIIGLSTKEGDRVLDFFLGSGTTAAVAHKMNRQYIGIDEMDYIEEVAVARLQKVIMGEQGGISAGLGWEGGGNFNYMELAYKEEKDINLSALENKDCSISPEDILLNQQLYSLKL